MKPIRFLLFVIIVSMFAIGIYKLLDDTTVNVKDINKADVQDLPDVEARSEQLSQKVYAEAPKQEKPNTDEVKHVKKKAKPVHDPKGCEPEKYWDKNPPYKCIDKPTDKPPVFARTTGGSGAVGNIEQMVREQAIAHGLDPNYMVQVAMCESGLGRDLVNEGYYAGGGNPTGIFQFLPETWTRISGRSPYGIGNILNHAQNIKVASWAFANGYAGEWECS